MQIQKIQSQDSLSKQNFKARFIYDKAGNFMSLWETSSKSSEFNSIAKQFSQIKNGILEIKEYTYECGVDNYKIFNHSTKKEKTVMNPFDRGGYDKVEYLINKLMEDMDFFKVAKRDNFVEKTHAAVPTFLKDKDGYFEVLYANSQKSPEYADKLAKFIESTKRLFGNL